MPTEEQIREAWGRTPALPARHGVPHAGRHRRAEDVVQEAFHRLSQSDFDAIEDARGWLIVVTSRLCLDVIRSARTAASGRWAAPLEAHAGAAARSGTSAAASLDPADRVTLDDGVRLALLVVLERLSPAERVAFVLHDIFGLSFDTVAKTVGRPEATCRQLARRAGLKLDAPESKGQRRDVTRRAPGGD